MSDNNLKPALEALLFASDKPLTLEQIKNALDTKETEQLRAVIQDLKSEYESTNRGMRIAEIANGYQMVTATNFAPFLKKLYKARHVERLSKPALETLAIIAYKQPLTKREIESLRNVNVDGVVKNLLEKDLIRVSGRKKAPGRPLVFATTRQFLEYFGLKSLEELPKMEDFSKLLVNQENINEPKESAPQN
jgi:segregation and condensation protein B